MKTKTFLFLCLLSVIGFTQLSAQNGKNGTGTSTWVEPIVGNTFDISIVCNGEEVDILNFPMYFELRIREHYKKGEFVWGKYLLNNAEYTSKKTGEVFKAHDLEKEYAKGIFTWFMNLNGNMGHHYIVRMVFETTNWEIIEYHSVCN
jgi:hypothetical protein